MDRVTSELKFEFETFLKYGGSLQPKDNGFSSQKFHKAMDRDWQTSCPLEVMIVVLL